MKKKEEWRIIPGYERYEASSFGRIRRAVSGPATRPGRIKTLQKSIDGYWAVNLFMGSKRVHRCNVHNLVCRAFHGLPPEGLDQTAHKDGSRTRNVPSNLRWTDGKGNAADREKHGNHPHGSASPNAILTERCIAEIRRSAAAGVMGTVIARRFGVHKSTIYLVINRKSWAHVT